jgi:apolipoprotein D and lipocalin family protein
MDRLMRCCRWLGGLAGWLAILAGCTAAGQGLPPLQTVPRVDLPRYVGTWYEIASYPHRFQRGCVASRAIYTLREDGTLGVTNECRQDTLDGPLRGVSGRARVADPLTGARLQVSFFWPIWGDYWIIDLDADYQWAVVGHPSRNYLWILSRTPGLDEALYQRILARLPDQGYDPARLHKTLQPGEPDR